MREALALVFFLVILSGLLLPALGTAGGSSSPAVFDVTVHSRERVGPYDTAVLSGENGNEILAWLNENGFLVPPESGEIIRDYAERGWFFAAAKLQRDGNSDIASATHPLSFTFGTDRAVYPMRLTGVGNESLSLQLYVVGDQEAQVAGLARQRAAWLDEELRGDRDEARRYARAAEKDDFVPVAHKSLRNYVKNGQALTLLAGELSPKEMEDDLWVEWKRLEPYRKLYYLPDGAQAHGAVWGSGVFLLGTIPAIIVLGRRRRMREKGGEDLPPHGRPALVFLGIVVGAALVGWIVYLLVPTAPRANLVRGGIRSTQQMHGMLAHAIDISAEGTPEERLSELREQVEKEFDNVVNPFSGKTVTHEDSPFNFTIELMDGAPTYFYYDEIGTKIKLRSYPVGDSGEDTKGEWPDV